MPAALTFTLAVAVTLTPAPLWDHPGYDAEDSHHNPHETVITSASIRRVTEKWQVRLRTSGESCAGFTGPLLSAGRVIVSDQLGISAYTADTGKISWRYDGDDPTESETPTLAVAGGLVIVAGGDCGSPSDPDGKLIALDARTGLPRWKQRLDTPIRSVVVDKFVIVVSGGSPSDEDTVAAYAVRDGRPLWSRTRSLSSGVSADGTILVRATDGSGTSAAVRITTGAQLWTRPGNWTAQAADAERFYLTDKSGKLSAARVTDGALSWTAPATPTTNLIAVDEKRLYRISGTKAEALDTHDGKTIWSTELTTEGRQPIRAGDLLYTGGPTLNPTDGSAAGPTFAAPMLVAGGRLHQIENGVLRSLAP